MRGGGAGGAAGGPKNAQFRFISDHNRGSKLTTVLAGGDCGHLHRKHQEKVKTRKMHATCGVCDDVTSFLLLVLAQVSALLRINRFHVHIIFNM